MAYSTIATISQDALIPLSTINQWGLNDQYLYENNGILDAKVGYSLLASPNSFIFSGIPSSYDHLILICFIKSVLTTNSDSILVRFNNDSGTNYDNASAAGQTAMNFPCSGSHASIPATAITPIVLTIPGYAQTTYGKAVSANPYTYYNTTTTPTTNGVWGGLWKSTAAVNRIDITPSAGANFTAGSSVAIFATQSV